MFSRRKKTNALDFNELRFRHNWRPYQKRVLDAIDLHLSDNRLHVVAAPGAGKTVLGLEAFLNHQVQVIILDEAHHLRAEWWKVLDQVCNEIPDLTLVALTATPPYDSQSAEWSRYEELCGPK